MTLSRSLPLSALLGLAACGSSSSPTTAPTNAFVGQLTITGTMPAGTTNCLATTVVTFMSTGVDHQTVTMPAGDCLKFVAGDATSYHPDTIGTTVCTELTAPVDISNGASFTTVPMDGPRVCHWQDTLHPPASGGGGGY